MIVTKLHQSTWTLLAFRNLLSLHTIWTTITAYLQASLDFQWNRACLRQ